MGSTGLMWAGRVDRLDVAADGGFMSVAPPWHGFGVAWGKVLLCPCQRRPEHGQPSTVAHATHFKPTRHHIVSTCPVLMRWRVLPRTSRRPAESRPSHWPLIVLSFSLIVRRRPVSV